MTMNNFSDLIQLRWNLGTIEYRQRLTRASGDGERVVVLNQFGPWRKIDAVKGDETDERFE